MLLVPSSPVASINRANAQRRAALVIGIGNYLRARKLPNAVPDADGLAPVLYSLGFDVSLQKDPSRCQLLSAIEEFTEEHRGADLVLVFFAGHGVQIHGRNWLLASNAKLASTEELQRTAIPLDLVVSKIAQVAPRRILLLDACRNDPFGAEHRIGSEGIEFGVSDPDGRHFGRPVVPGLGRIGRADGALYAFAAAPGATASDGVHGHSPFAQALMTHLGAPGLEIGSIMKLVQMEVYDRTGGRQLPYLEDALPELVFADTKGEPLPERDRLLLAIADLDLASRAQVERVAATYFVPLAPLYARLFAIRAERGKLDFDDRERQLVQAAEAYAKVEYELRTLASSDPKVLHLRAKAEAELSVGALTAAHAALGEAIALDRTSSEQLEARLRERNRSEAASLGARAGISRTSGRAADYVAAADDYAAAAKLTRAWDPAEAARFVLLQAETLREHGRDYGWKDSLRKAVALCRDILTFVPSEQNPPLVREVLTTLGGVLTTLGQRETGAECLTDAVQTYEAVLADCDRERDPLTWAAAQSRLGEALFRLGERESSIATLIRAVSAFRAALSERTRERNPLEWARTQRELGGALARIGERETSSDRLNESTVAYRAALAELTRECSPLEWAGLHNSLGFALWRLALRDSDVAHLNGAVSAYRSALQEFTRERLPLAWAMTQNNLGNSLRDLGVLQRNSAYIEEGIAAYRSALEERTRERVPLDWAMTLNNVANALAELDDLEGVSLRADEALDAFHAALTEYTRERVPMEWARVQHNICILQRDLGRRKKHRAYLRLAAGSARAALQERTRERGPFQWAMTQSALGNVIAALGELDRSPSLLREAIGIYERALEEYTRERVPRSWAELQHDLGLAYRALGLTSNTGDELEIAIAHFRAALSVRELQCHARPHADSLYELATTLPVVAVRRGSAGHLAEARCALASAFDRLRSIKDHCRAEHVRAQLCSLGS